jgi:hypothetical protein
MASYWCRATISRRNWLRRNSSKWKAQPAPQISPMLVYLPQIPPACQIATVLLRTAFVKTPSRRNRPRKCLELQGSSDITNAVLSRIAAGGWVK